MTAAKRASSNTAAPRRAATSIRESLREYGRGICGGFLFSMPLLYTMEVWWTGLTVSPGRLLVGFAMAYALLCAYNAYAGLHHDTSVTEILIDSVEELGLGLVVSALVLVMLGRLQYGTLADVVGQIVLEALFVAIGVSVGTAQLMGGQGGNNNSGGRGRHDSLRAEFTLALCGALLIAANVAPTEEIMMLAAMAGITHLLAVMGMSLLLAGTLLYFSHFRGSARFAEIRGADAILQGTAITYATALVASAGLLWFFGRFNGTAPVMGAAQVVLLGLPATLGASAGRLLLR
jgi:putative integral membrane protein (TIGR02587 family)